MPPEPPSQSRGGLNPDQNDSQSVPPSNAGFAPTSRLDQIVSIPRPAQALVPCFVYINNPRRLAFVGERIISCNGNRILYFCRRATVVTRESFAMKVEAVNNERNRIFPGLRFEKDVYRAIESANAEDKVGFAKIHFYGETRSKDLRVMVTDCLDEDLDNYLIRSGGRLPMVTALIIGLQALKRIETLHKFGFLHRDIQLKSLMMKAQDPHTVYLVGLGSGKRFRNPDGTHIPFASPIQYKEHPLFSSALKQNRGEMSRRDDLESLGYVIIYMCQGQLPWSLRCFQWENLYELARELCIGGSDDHVLRRFNYLILKQKQMMLSDLPLLCRGMPAPMISYFSLVRDLAFDQDPNYGLLRFQLVAAILASLQFTY